MEYLKIVGSMLVYIPNILLFETSCSFGYDANIDADATGKVNKCVSFVDKPTIHMIETVDTIEEHELKCSMIDTKCRFCRGWISGTIYCMNGKCYCTEFCRDTHNKCHSN
jgi:hypothetical protein